MENLIAKNQESALLHIENNYGKFTTNWYRQLGGVEERQIGDNLIVRTCNGECPCGETLHYFVIKSENNEQLANYTVCESCYKEEGGDDEGSNGIIWMI